MDASPAVVPQPAKSAPVGPVPQPQVLPRSVSQLLSWLDPKEYRKVETLLCLMPSTRELILVTRFLDQIWNHARNAEYRMGASRITGAEMDEYFERWKMALHELLKIGIELGVRTGLTEIMQKHRVVLAHFGYGPSGRPIISSGEKESAAAKAPKAAKPASALVASA